VLGSEDSITAMARDDIAAYHGAHYQPSNVVFAVAGNMTHEAVMERIDAHFPLSEAVRPERPRSEPSAPQPLVVLNRETEQAHVVTGVRALPALDPDRYALTVVNQVLGGGMSSRLFQEIRETRGLAYSVFSYHASFDDAGYLAIYAGTAPEHVPETLALIEAELDRLVDKGLSDSEIAGAKGHLVGSLAMSLETSASRMRRLGRSELIEGEIPSLEELIARVEAVDADDVARVIDRVFAGAPRTLAVVGPHSSSDFAASAS
jgi:predicted Zn-dependent peptidase